MTLSIIPDKRRANRAPTNPADLITVQVCPTCQALPGDIHDCGTVWYGCHLCGGDFTGAHDCTTPAAVAA